MKDGSSERDGIELGQPDLYEAVLDRMQWRKITNRVSRCILRLNEH